MNKYFILFPTCVPTKGAKRSIIQDLQRREIQFIPNDMFDFLIECNKKSISEIYKKYKKYQNIIKEYIDFLIEKEYAFIGSHNDILLIQELDFYYEYPGDISNSIIELSAKNIKRLDNILDQLNELKCQSLQLVSYESKLDMNSLEEIMIKFEGFTYLTNILIITKYQSDFEFEQLTLFCRKNLRISEIIIHSSPYEKEESFRNGSFVKFVKEKTLNGKSCGVINSTNFCLSENQLFESKCFNSCLNKKVGIDTEGNIRNCPNMKKSFGSIEDRSIKDVIHHKDFKKYWKITKDEIDTCKECEFRHICTDCRAFVEDPNNDYSKPLKCGYNPHTNKWEDWSKNPLKKKGLEYYGI